MMVQLLLFQDESDAPHHGLAFDLPGVPRAGDLLTITRLGQEGCTDYVVRRAIWDLDYPAEAGGHRAGAAPVGSATAVTVECLFRVGPYASEEHKRAPHRAR